MSGGAAAPVSSVMVAADAQFSVARILRPFDGFEAVYQGQSYDIQIAFPGGLDPRAGQTGVAPNLMKGLPVPLGARLAVWIPIAMSPVGGGGFTTENYNYTFIWRLRNVRDFRQDRKAYHFPRQSPGAPDTSGPTQPRFVIPAASDVVIYEQAEPANPFEPAVQRVYTQTYTVGPGITPATEGTNVLLPDGSQGIYQQGVLDPGAGGLGELGSGAALFQPLWMDAMGDELIIVATRADPGQDPTWDFTDATKDLPFSDIYGTGNGSHPAYPDLGIYVFTGSNP